MNRRRLIQCPPNGGTSAADNPFERIPPYRFLQATFKSFSDEEIRNQAGRESLPKVSREIPSLPLDGGPSFQHTPHLQSNKATSNPQGTNQKRVRVASPFAEKCESMI